ncbi:MAG TPA: cupin domain-containing protein [Kofleriaceae bacterium]|nr:cupin domain-containing protein [Kofleriaceae bacterium]
MAAIQKAMNELDKAAQQCWAVAAVERFDIAGDLTLRIDIGSWGTKAVVVNDTAHNTKLSDCVVRLMEGYRWAPPLYGQTIQLPFQFRAPDGQNTIDRALVPSASQGAVSVAVLIDQANTNSDAASMFEVGLEPAGETGLRHATRAELWYFLSAGEVSSPGGGSQNVAAGDMMYVPRGGLRDVASPEATLRAMVVMVPGGREGAARGGALPTPAAPGGVTAKSPPVKLFRAAAAKSFGPVKVHADASAIPDKALSASVVTLPAGAKIAEHVHASAELLYLLAGTGTVTVNGVDLPLTPTTVVQIPKNTKHALVATSELRAVLLYTPAGPERGWKAHP